MHVSLPEQGAGDLVWWMHTVLLEEAIPPRNK